MEQPHHNDVPVPEDLPGDTLRSYNPALTHLESSGAFDRQRQTVSEVPESSEGMSFQRRLGLGGFGEVWEGVQASLGRVVAIKRLREDYAESGDESMLRYLRESFRHEAVTAASLDHPNIVPLYDLGDDARGNPLLSMKLVRGVPWDRMIADDFLRLDAREFLHVHLPILASVCQAVAFAHSRGVVHRDIKPSQVMIGEFGEVNLMDWGLAVVFDQERAAEYAPALARPGVPTIESASNPAGTAAFMAPEQTRSSPAGLGTWTDVYLLGGTLYYLLTGALPHGNDGKHVVFRRASLGIVTPPERADAANRGVPPELGALAMDAMRVLPGDRVDSAKEFLRRLQDYMTGATRRRDAESLAAQGSDAFARYQREGRGLDPRAAFGLVKQATELAERSLQLWPESETSRRLLAEILASRTREEIARGDLHAAEYHLQDLDKLLPADGAVLASLRSEWVAQRDSRRRAARQRHALAAAASVSVLLLLGVSAAAWWTTSRSAEAERAARVESDRQRDQSAAAKERADRLVGFMLVELPKQIAVLDPKLGPLAPINDELLGYYRSMDFAQIDGAEAERVQRGLDACANVFRMQLDVARMKQVVELQEQLCRPRFEAGGAGSNRWGAALAAAIYYRAQILASESDAAESAKAVEEGLAMCRKLEPAIFEDHAGSIAYFHMLVQDGDRLRNNGDYDAALARFREASALANRWIEREPSNADWRECQAGAITWVAAMAQDQGRLDEALAGFAAGRVIVEALAAEQPNNTNRAQSVGRACDSVAAVLLRLDRQAEAEEAALAALEARRKAARLRPELIEYRIDECVGIKQLARVAMARGQRDRAVALLEEALAGLRTAREMAPKHHDTADHLSGVLSELANVHMGAQRPSLAEPYIAELNKVTEELIGGTDSEVPADLNALASVRHWTATLRYNQGRYDDALRIFGEAAALRRKAVKIDGENLHIMQQLANTTSWIAATLRETGDLSGNAEAHAETLAIYRRLVELRPGTGGFEAGLSTLSRSGAMGALDLGNLERASELAADAIRLADRKVLSATQERPELLESAQARMIRAAVLDELGRGAEAIPFLDEAAATLRPLLVSVPDDTEVLSALASALSRRARLRLPADPVAALADAEEAMAAIAKLPQEPPDSDAFAQTTAFARIARGLCRSARNDREGAQDDWEAAIAAVHRSTGWERNPRRLDPLTRALVLLGRRADAEPHAAALRSMGYKLPSWVAAMEADS